MYTFSEELFSIPIKGIWSAKSHYYASVLGKNLQKVEKNPDWSVSVTGYNFEGISFDGRGKWGKKVNSRIRLYIWEFSQLHVLAYLHKTRRKQKTSQENEIMVLLS